MSAEDAGSSSREYDVRIPSLFEIFWGKLANWFRLLAKWRKQGLLKKALEAARRRRAMRLETLEPRVLLSTDISGAAALLHGADFTLAFVDGSTGDAVRLIDHNDGDSFTDYAIDSDHVINVNIGGGQLQDKLLIDFGFTGTQDSGDKPTLNVTFNGADEVLPADLSPIDADLLKIQNSGGMFTLAGLDIHSTEAVEIAGNLTVE